MEESKNNLLYRPELKPERHYESAGSFNDDIRKIVYEDNPSKTETINDLIDTMEQMSDIIANGPEDIAHLARSVDKLRQRLIVAFPDGYREPPKEIVPITPGISDIIKEEMEKKKIDLYEPDDVGYAPSSVFEPNDNGIEIEVLEPRSTLNIAIASYARDTVDLQKYYVDSMQKVLQSYYNQMLATAAGAGLSDFSILEKNVYAENISVPNSNLTHLKDYIARSQNSRIQKASYFKKTHNEDQTMIHMRRWHAAEKERERYYSEEYGDSSTVLGHESNELLRQSRKMYDAQYRQSLYDMYKYLDSSVSVAGDILTMSANEAKAKGHLIKSGANVVSAIVKNKRPEYLSKTVATGSNVVTNKKADSKKDEKDKNAAASNSKNDNNSTSNDKKATSSGNSIYEKAQGTPYI